VVDEGIERGPVVSAVLSDVFCALVELLLTSFDFAFSSFEILMTNVLLWGWVVVEGVSVERMRRRERIFVIVGH